jgi:hypothetical protein
MVKNECFQRRVARYASLILALFAFVYALLKPTAVFSYEREIILSEEYQTEEEKERLKDMIKPEEEKIRFKDRFQLDFSFGYGFSYASAGIISGLYGLSKEYETYLDRLDMEFSENLVQVRLTATYLLSPKMGIYLGLPAGVVEEKSEGLFDDSENVSAGVGDVYGGIFYNVLSETKYRPSVVIDFVANSNIAKFNSLGDGCGVLHWAYNQESLWQNHFIFLE